MALMYYLMLVLQYYLYDYKNHVYDDGDDDDDDDDEKLMIMMMIMKRND